MNVVSIPTDYGFQKMRCCEYKVLGDYDKKPLDDDFMSTEPQYSDVYASNDDEDDYDSGCDDDCTTDYEAQDDGDGWFKV